MFRLLQSDVLDHLPAHQRRGRGRPRAARGGEVNDDDAVLRIEKKKKGQKSAQKRAFLRVGTRPGPRFAKEEAKTVQ